MPSRRGFLQRSFGSVELAATAEASSLRAVVLAGGEGERMRASSRRRTPKVALRISGLPLIAWVVRGAGRQPRSEPLSSRDRLVRLRQFEPRFATSAAMSCSTHARWQPSQLMPAFVLHMKRRQSRSSQVTHSSCRACCAERSRSIVRPTPNRQLSWHGRHISRTLSGRHTICNRQADTCSLTSIRLRTPSRGCLITIRFFNIRMFSSLPTSMAMARGDFGDVYQLANRESSPARVRTNITDILTTVVNVNTETDIHAATTFVRESYLGLHPGSDSLVAGTNACKSIT